MFADTHCHLNTMVVAEYGARMTEQDLPRVDFIVQEAHEKQVDLLITIGCSLAESMEAIQLTRRYTTVYASIGIHPNDTKESWREDVAAFKNLIATDRDEKIVAIGECGLDRHYPGYNLPRQTDCFKAQIELALTYNKALVVHTRDAADETLRILDEYRGQITRAVIHCFSENVTWAQDVLEMGYYLGIGGTVTYPKNDSVRQVVLHTSLDKIVLETDAPFLAPQAVRGTLNTPANIPLIAEYIAQLKGVTVEAVAEHTTRNARKLFGIKAI